MENVEEVKLKAAENLKNRVRPLVKFSRVEGATFVSSMLELVPK